MNNKIKIIFLRYLTLECRVLINNFSSFLIKYMPILNLLKLFSYMNRFKILLLFVSLLFTSISTFSQINMPYVQNFSKGDYQGGTQNWAIAQGKDGIMYFGNNAGLLSYDGKKWKLYRLPSKLRIRSLYVDTDGRIYCGAFEEFGYWEKDDKGTLNYYSLAKKVHKFKFHNDEIWGIVKLKNKIFFQSFSSFFSYDGKLVIGSNLPFNPLSFHVVKDKIYAGTSQKGFYQYDGKKFERLFSNSALGNSDVISSLLLDKESGAIATVYSGVYLYKNGKITKYLAEYDSELRSAVINRMILTRDSLLVIGTIHNGIYAFNNKQQLVWKVSKVNGLQNNTILGLFSDSVGNVWAALDNGISLIYINNNLRFSSSQFEKIGSVYTAVYSPPYLYLGTNQGLFVYNYKQGGSVDLIPGTSGQIWDLSLVDGQVLCGHNEQTYRVEGTKATKLINVSGGACMKKFEYEGSQYLIQGTYTYLVLYKKNKQGDWAFMRTINGFMNPIRYIEIDQNMNVWASHIERGLYRIKLDNNLSKAKSVKTYYSLEKGSSATKINVFKLQGRVVFGDGKKLYTYNDLTDSIVPFDRLNEQLYDFKSLHKIISVGDNRYWLVKDDQCALVQYAEGRLTFIKRVPFSLLNSKVPEQYENIIAINEQSYLFCMENALALYSVNKHQSNHKTVRLFINMVKVQELNGKSAFLLPLNSSKKVHFPYDAGNKITFDVAFPDFKDKESYFRYRLVGLDNRWSDQTKLSTIDFSRLPYGTYRFEVKAYSSEGHELATSAYDFIIDPPFYASIYAYIFYILLLILFGYQLKAYVRRTIERDKLKLKAEQEHQLQEQRERQERNIIQLKNEKLESELLHKSKEMASSTMSIINKNKVLQVLKEELTEQKQVLGTQFPNKYYNKLIQIIDQNISSEDDWAVFQSNFDRIHENFFRNLKLTYPDITPNDLKLCAYLRLNLSTKDIAHLLNISIRGVEVARYRLRKKMNIPSEKNLIDFMIEFK